MLFMMLAMRRPIGLIDLLDNLARQEEMLGLKLRPSAPLEKRRLNPGTTENLSTTEH